MVVGRIAVGRRRPGDDVSARIAIGECRTPFAGLLREEIVGSQVVSNFDIQNRLDRERMMGALVGSRGPSRSSSAIMKCAGDRDHVEAELG